MSLTTLLLSSLVRDMEALSRYFNDGSARRFVYQASTEPCPERPSNLTRSPIHVIVLKAKGFHGWTRTTRQIVLDYLRPRKGYDGSAKAAGLSIGFRRPFSDQSAGDPPHRQPPVPHKPADHCRHKAECSVEDQSFCTY
jgi:hypothetical protein